MKSVLVILISVTLLSNVKAANYYFSTSLGSDDRAPRQAQNPSTPWKTLGKLNAYFSSLRPGDAVLLKRGETFYGSIIVNSSGTANSPIVIGAYGTGNKPVITSLVTLTGWTANDTYKGVYESSANSSLGAIVNTVLLNEVPQQLGRYPNSDAANKGYLIFESHSGLSSITDNNLTSSVNWTGAELVLRSKRWVLDRDIITSQSGNTLSYTASSKYEPSDKFGYFIQNDIKTLDEPGEWYYNSSTKKLSVFFGRSAPSQSVIKASAVDNLISSSGFSNVVFDNLIVKGANVNGVLIKDGSNITMTNCDILFSGTDGVRVSNHRSFDIENCTVANSNNNGINLGYTGGNNSIIRNNEIVNTSVLAGMGGSGDAKGFAILCSGKSTVIEYNDIRNTGYSAVSFNGDNTIVKNNFIDSFCVIKDDGSAIYTYTGTPKGGDNVTNTGRMVVGNIVMNGVGMPEGTNSKNLAANGIYMDVGATGVNITGNTVTNSSAGIFFHKAHDLMATNNTLYDNQVGLYLQHNGSSNAITNNTITNNIFFPKNPKQMAISMETSGDDIDKIGVLDSNYYFNPAGGDRVFKQVSHDNSGKNNSGLLNLSDWKNAHPHDVSSKNMVMPGNGNTNDLVRFEYNSTKQNKTISLNGNYKDAANNSYSNSVVLKPYTSILLLKQGGRSFR